MSKIPDFTPDKYSAALGLAITSYAAGDSTAELFTPDSTGEKYLVFCDTLKLKQRPNVLVIDSKNNEHFEHGEQGLYAIASNLVVVPRDVFEGFKKSEPVADYCVAHELGHAESFQETSVSRRKMLAYLGAAVAGVGVQQAAYSTLKQPKEKETHKWRYFNLGTSSVAGLAVAGLALLQVEGLIFRAEEFRADDNAAKILPPLRMLEAMSVYMENSCNEPRQKAAIAMSRTSFNQVVEKREKEGKPLSPEQKVVLWATVLGRSSRDKIDLKDIVKGDYYPGPSRRLNRQLEKYGETLKGRG